MEDSIKNNIMQFILFMLPKKYFVAYERRFNSKNLLWDQIH